MAHANMDEIDKLQVLVIANYPFHIAVRAWVPEDVDSAGTSH